MPLTFDTVRFIDPPPPGSDWAACVDIRRRVFCLGQSCPEDEEFDGLDAAAHQVLARLGGVPAATARWRVVDAVDAGRAKLERFAVLERFRGRGLGRRLVDEVVRRALAAGHGELVLHAQEHLCGLYAGFGFRAVGPGFEEAGIPHRRMVASAAAVREARSANRADAAR